MVTEQPLVNAAYGEHIVLVPCIFPTLALCVRYQKDVQFHLVFDLY